MACGVVLIAVNATFLVINFTKSDAKTNILTKNIPIENQTQNNGAKDFANINNKPNDPKVEKILNNKHLSTKSEQNDVNYPVDEYSIREKVQHDFSNNRIGIVDYNNLGTSSTKINKENKINVEGKDFNVFGPDPFVFHTEYSGIDVDRISYIYKQPSNLTLISYLKNYPARFLHNKSSNIFEKNYINFDYIIKPSNIEYKINDDIRLQIGMEYNKYRIGMPVNLNNFLK